MEKEVILTYEGLKQLEDELEMLKSVKRREVAERIKIAIGFGDLSENSEYDDAKNEQAAVESRILQLEAMLRNAQVVSDEDVDNTTVGIGNIVTVLDIDENEEMVYKIVGTTEVDVLNNKISNESPVGSAILGKKKGAKVKVVTPAGEMNLKIVKIQK